MEKEKLKIIVICVENARRSQIAQKFAEAFDWGKVKEFGGALDL